MGLGILPLWGMAKVAGMAECLTRVRRGGEEKVLIFMDSKAAIAAVKRAGRTGKDRSRHLQKIVNEVAEIRERGGEVKLGWVKANMGILDYESRHVGGPG